MSEREKCILHASKTVASHFFGLLEPNWSNGIHSDVKSKADESKHAQENRHWCHRNDEWPRSDLEGIDDAGVWCDFSSRQESRNSIC